MIKSKVCFLFKSNTTMCQIYVDITVSCASINQIDLHMFYNNAQLFYILVHVIKSDALYFLIIRLNYFASFSRLLRCFIWYRHIFVFAQLASPSLSAFLIVAFRQYGLHYIDFRDPILVRNKICKSNVNYKSKIKKIYYAASCTPKGHFLLGGAPSRQKLSMTYLTKVVVFISA